MKKIIGLIFLLNIMLSQRVVGYYPQWVVGNLQPEDIDLSIVSHVIHSFAWPNEDGSISSYDGMFGSGMSETIHAQGSKFLLSLGGWGNDIGFEVISADADLRELFINNLASICLINGYDGIDLDWEFPDSENDKENLNLLVSEMDSIFSIINPEWLITMAIPVSNWYGQWHDFEFLNQYVDFFNAMTYGTHGNWSSHSGHLSPLYPSPAGDPDGSCHDNMFYLSTIRNIPKSKINIGMPFWGLKWNSPDINEPFTGNTTDIYFNEINNLIGDGWTEYWDSDALCPYLIKNDNTQIITYENPLSIGIKCQYAIEEGLGGLMIWALSYDKTDNGQELIQSIQENYLKTFLEESLLIPENIFLKVYPNPFNPSCELEILLTDDQFVRVTVNDILGREIQILNNKTLLKGFHQISWTPKIEPSGIYFFKIETETIIKTNKVVFVR
jgi:chitinase